MRGHESFWELVDTHLDARFDPLDDARVRDYLEANPELLDSYAQLTASVRALDTAPQRSRKNATRAVLAALAILALGAWLACPTEEAEPEIVLPDLAADVHVLRHSSRTYTRGPNGEMSLELEAGAVAITERAVLSHTEPRAATPHGHAIHTVLTKETHRLRPEHITED